MSDELVNEPGPLLPQGRWFKILVAVAVVVAGGFVGLRALHDRDEAPTGPRPIASSPHAPGDLTAGLFINGKAPSYTVAYSYSSDADVHVLVLRSKKTGSVGHHTAVVSYPAKAAMPGGSYVDVSVGGAIARVRGDLPRPELSRITRALRIVAGHPTVVSLPDYVVASGGTYGGCQLLESWYESKDIGFDRWFGSGTVYTILTDCGGLEDSLVAHGARPGPHVYARPSALSPVLGGNITLTWELSAGLYGIVGYSGFPVSSERIDVLTSIAKETRTYGAKEWDTTHPFSQRTEDLAGWAP